MALISLQQYPNVKLNLLQTVSLKDAILKTYDYQYGVRLSSDIPYHIFSAFDLLYSGLIPDELQTNLRDAVLKTTRWRDLSKMPGATAARSNKQVQKDTNRMSLDTCASTTHHYFPRFPVGKPKGAIHGDLSTMTQHFPAVILT